MSPAPASHATNTAPDINSTGHTVPRHATASDTWYPAIAETHASRVVDLQRLGNRDTLIGWLFAETPCRLPDARC